MKLDVVFPLVLKRVSVEMVYVCGGNNRGEHKGCIDNSQQASSTLSLPHHSHSMGVG
jgi:hypothetical protein